MGFREFECVEGYGVSLSLSFTRLSQVILSLFGSILPLHLPSRRRILFSSLLLSLSFSQIDRVVESSNGRLVKGSVTFRL